MLTIDAQTAGAAALGLVASLALLPVARHIPIRLRRQWDKDAEAILAERHSAVPQETAFSPADVGLMACTGALLGILVITTYGTTVSGAAFGLFFLAFLLLVAVNTKHMLLPDMIVLPVMWGGLLYHTAAGSGVEQIHGAAAGYLVPYVLVTIIRMAAGIEIMGGGDLKTFAMAGAWFGIHAVPTLLLAFILGTFALAPVRAALRQKNQGAIPTGSAHLLASVTCALGVRLF